MPALLTIELGEYLAAVALVFDHMKQVQRFGNAPVLGDGLPEGGEAPATL